MFLTTRAPLAKSSSILGWPRPAQSTEIPPSEFPLGPLSSGALFALFAALVIILHASLLRLPYFWDEAGYYIPAARDLLAGSLIPHSTPSNAHPPLVLAWLALGWKLFGQNACVTRSTMLLLAAFSLLGFFRLARAVSNNTVATASTCLMAVYPVFFTQSSLAQIDLPAAGLTFWALEAYVERRSTAMSLWFSLAALAKETAILIPIALFLWPLFKSRLSENSRLAQWALAREPRDRFTPASALLFPIIPLSLWYAYHFTRTGIVFGNPEFFRYNVQATLHPLRIFLALLLRGWQTVGYLGLYVLTLACFLAMKYPPLTIDERFSATTPPVQSQAPTAVDREPATGGAMQRPKIAIPSQL